MKIQKLYQEALKFASAKHAEKDQKVPGTNLPYAVHISNVAMEILIAGYHTPDFNLSFGIQVALLHDTLEDTKLASKRLKRSLDMKLPKVYRLYQKTLNYQKKIKCLTALIG